MRKILQSARSLAIMALFAISVCLAVPHNENVLAKFRIADSTSVTMNFNVRGGEPVLAPEQTWFTRQATISKSQVTSISSVSSGSSNSDTVPGSFSWDASRDENGSVTAIAIPDVNIGTYSIVLNPSYGDTILNPDSSNAFSGFTNLTKIDIITNVDGTKNYDASRVTNAASMFANCSHLKAIDMSVFEEAEITNMQSMLNGCAAITSLDLSKVNTAYVTASSGLASFAAGCSNLTSITFGGNFGQSYNIPTAGSSAGMFYVSTVTPTAISAANPTMLQYGWATDNRTLPQSILAPSETWLTINPNVAPASISSIKVAAQGTVISGASYVWDASSGGTGSVIAYAVNDGGGYYNVTLVPENSVLYANPNSNNAFAALQHATSIDVTALNTTLTTSMSAMFSGCSSLASINLSNFDTSGVTNLSYFASDCPALTTIVTGANFGQYNNVTSTMFTTSSLTLTNVSCGSATMQQYDWLMSANRPRAYTIDAFILRLYNVFLLRTPSASEINNWRSNYYGNNSAIQTAAGIVFSSEASRYYSDSTDYVTKLYYGLLQRSPDAGGLAAFTSACATSGYTAAYNGIATSGEFANVCANTFHITQGSALAASPLAMSSRRLSVSALQVAASAITASANSKTADTTAAPSNITSDIQTAASGDTASASAADSVVSSDNTAQSEATAEPSQASGITPDTNAVTAESTDATQSAEEIQAADSVVIPPPDAESGANSGSSVPA